MKRDAVIPMLAATWMLVTAGCSSSRSPSAVAPPPPPVEAAPAPVRTYDYAHTVRKSPKHRKAHLYTIAILRFGDSKEIEDQPFGEKPEQRPRPEGAQEKVEVNVNVGNTNVGAAPGAQARQQLDKRARETLKHELVESEAFTVVERERILEILREIEMGKSKYADPATAGAEGSLLSVRYLLEGSLGFNEDLSLKETLPEQGYEDYSYEGGLSDIFNPSRAAMRRRFIARMNARRERMARQRHREQFPYSCYLSVYDVHTGQVICSVMGIGKNGLGAIRDAVAELVEAMPEKAGNGVRVAAVSGEKVYLDVGARAGLQEGDLFQVRHRGEPVRDRFGQIIGFEETETGEIKVVEVRELMSVAEFVGQAGQAGRGDLVVPAKH
jgi:hypothetical protein